MSGVPNGSLPTTKDYVIGLLIALPIIGFCLLVGYWFSHAVVGLMLLK